MIKLTNGKNFYLGPLIPPTDDPEDKDIMCGYMVFTAEDGSMWDMGTVIMSPKAAYNRGLIPEATKEALRKLAAYSYTNNAKLERSIIEQIGYEKYLPERYQTRNGQRV